MIKVDSTWNKEDGLASTIIKYNNKEFIGIALCHPDDEDFKSSWTGTAISEFRAYIAYLKHVRDNELRPHLKCLCQLYYSMNRSKKFNPRGYEAKTLYRAIKRTEKDLKAVQQEIENIKNDLKNYIDNKEELFIKIRARRKAGQDKTTSNN